MGRHFILQGMFLTQGANPYLPWLLRWQADSFLCTTWETITCEPSILTDISTLGGMCLLDYICYISLYSYRDDLIYAFILIKRDLVGP